MLTLCSLQGKEGAERLAFSAKIWLPESWVRCKNSKCRDPNSARMLLLPAMAQPQLLWEPLKRQKQLGSPPAGGAGSSAPWGSTHYVLSTGLGASPSHPSESSLGVDTVRTPVLVCVLPKPARTPVYLMRMFRLVRNSPTGHLNPGLSDRQRSSFLRSSSSCKTCGLLKDMSRAALVAKTWHRRDAKFTGNRDNAVRDHKDPPEHSISTHLFKGN